MRKNKRVAAYLRIDGGSADYQRRQAALLEREIRSHHGWELAGVYMDVGDRYARENFLRLVDDCKRGGVDLIVTPTVTRFGRTLTEAMNTVRGLYLERSVGVLFRRENLDTSGDGNIPALLQIHEMNVRGAQQKPVAYAAART
jgi:DNA invertase Pin-like site-specific DNA recombinase